ncbi:MAG: hypothetical protein ABL883_01410 [Terricaulis sp.]
MMEFQLWMFPIGAAVLMYGMHLVVMWRLNASERRWLREHARDPHTTAAE